MKMYEIEYMPELDGVIESQHGIGADFDIICSKIENLSVFDSSTGETIRLTNKLLNVISDYCLKRVTGWA